MKKKYFRLIKKPLLVNEAGLLVYLYISWLGANNKNNIAFEDSFPSYNFSENNIVTRISDKFSYSKSYIDFSKKIRKDSFSHLSDFFKDNNKDILNLFSLYEENDQDYFPFMAVVFQNINIFYIDDFSYEIFKKTFDLFFLKFIGVDLDELESISNYQDLKAYTERINIIKYISKLTYDDRSIMYLLRSYHNTKNIYDRIYPLISKISDIISQNFYLIEDLFKENINYIYEDNYKNPKDFLNQVGLEDFLDKIASPLDIYSLILIPNTVMIQVYSCSMEDPFIKFGIFSSRKNQKKSNKLSPAKQILKILADPTRIDIIDLLKDKTYYAKELSDKLFISPPTLSYHLNQLQLGGFIGFYVEGRKSYYYLRKTGFDNIIKTLDEFTKEIRQD